MPSQQQTLEQQRAAQAYKDVQAAKAKPYRAKYGPLTKKMPSYILTNGLGQALAFLQSKGKQEDKEHTLLYRHISDWVVKQPNDLLARIMDPKTTSAAYRRLTAETLAYLNWLRRFAEAEPDLKADALGDDA